ncbi:hypothetical protein K503DRAFT_607533 [Rhizopogon vinicolor AM-OR11-026]|uniref:Uncharacterized protein n=1 Tax=Rhizopogon vinicolor AM-OR11-026 TaxID=1314800 RepID=A0A1B7N6L0_9AGAM|nr:hypothetical protein K503DRAFT_607533 [Rhizopogon vinicolor AM-OR11-026]
MNIYHLKRFSTALAFPRRLSGESSNYRRRVTMLCSTPMGFVVALVFYISKTFTISSVLSIIDQTGFLMRCSTCSMVTDWSLFTSPPFMYRELVRAGISRKWPKKIGREQNEERHADFIRRMAQ